MPAFFQIWDASYKAHIYIERLSRRLSVLEKEIQALKREPSNTTLKPRSPPVVTAEK